MKLAIYVVLWFTNMCLGVAGLRNKILSISTYLLLAILFVSNNGELGDAKVYKTHFEKQLVDGAFEKGYSFLERTVYHLGQHSYTALLGALLLIVIVFLLAFFKDLQCSHHVIIATIMPFIFPTYCTATRFFVASVIALLAIKNLMRKKPVAFLLLIILAISFHNMSIFYILFYFCSTDKMNMIGSLKGALFGIIGFFSFVSLLILYTSGRFIMMEVLAKTASLFIPNIESKVEAYTTTSAHIGSLIFVCIYIIGFLAAYILKSEIDAIPIDVHDDGNSIIQLKALSKINLNINVLLSSILPLIATSLVFYRYIIIGQVLTAVVFGEYINAKRRYSKVQGITINVISIMIMLMCTVWFVPEFFGINDITIMGLFNASRFF